jgi:hypothetical protein
MVWLISPHTEGDTTQLVLHAVSGTVAVCGRTADEGGFFKPRPTLKSTTCKTCAAAHKHGDADLITSNELTKNHPISYRQLDYWIRTKLVKPVEAHPGTGSLRHFTRDEANVVITMAKLVDLGFSPQLANIAARNNGRIAPGVRVVIEHSTAA